MSSIQITPGYHHVVLGGPWVGEFPLLKNGHSILYMPVKKIYPHRRPCHRSSRTALNQVVPRSSRGQEFHLVRLWLFSSGVWMPNSVSPPPPAHFASSCALSSTQAPYPPRTPYTAPVPSSALGSKGPLPSSVARTPPPTESLPPGMGRRLCQLSSRLWSTGLPY